MYTSIIHVAKINVKDLMSHPAMFQDSAADKIMQPGESMKERRLSLHNCLSLCIYITLTHVIILMS